MASTTRRSPATAKAKRPSLDQNFYEALPMTMGQHYVYRDDIESETIFDTTTTASTMSIAADPSVSAKRLAIVTLMVVALVAVAAGVLISQGLTILRETAPAAGITTAP